MTPLFTVSGQCDFLPQPLELQLFPRQLCAVSGPSGVGKSRLLRALADLDASALQLTLNGRTLSRYRPDEWRRQVGFVPAESAWWSERLSDHFYAECPVDWLQALQLPADIMRWDVTRLSSGERQRLAVLRTLVLRPKVLLLDEPTANLDDDNAMRLEALLQRYLSGQQACALWVSHDPQQLQRVGQLLLRLLPETVELQQ